MKDNDYQLKKRRLSAYFLALVWCSPPLKSTVFFILYLSLNICI